jgi:hypothetical protein
VYKRYRILFIVVGFSAQFLVFLASGHDPIFVAMESGGGLL